VKFLAKNNQLTFVFVVEVVDVNWQSFDGKTALLLAAAEGHSTCVQLLLLNGADVNLSDCMDEAPLLAGRIISSLFVVQNSVFNVIEVNCYSCTTYLLLQLSLGIYQSLHDTV